MRTDRPAASDPAISSASWRQSSGMAQAAPRSFKNFCDAGDIPAGVRINRREWKADCAHMNAMRRSETAAIRFLIGSDEDYPVLLPLTGPGGNTARSIAFCRAIHPTASLLVPDLKRLQRATPGQGKFSEAALLEKLAGFLTNLDFRAGAVSHYCDGAWNWR
jgi:hypothetical protein